VPDSNHEEALKRSACSIASQLPADREDAETVLSFVAQILENLGSKRWEAMRAFGTKIQVASPADEPAVLIDFPGKASQA
jgi:hypothetical protein